MLLIRIEEWISKHFSAIIFLVAFALHIGEGITTAQAAIMVFTPGVIGSITLYFSFCSLVLVQFIAAQKIGQSIKDLIKDNKNVLLEIFTLIVATGVYLFMVWSLMRTNLVLDNAMPADNILPQWLQQMFGIDISKIEDIKNPTLNNIKMASIANVILMAIVFLEVLASLYAVKEGLELRFSDDSDYKILEELEEDDDEEEEKEDEKKKSSDKSKDNDDDKEENKNSLGNRFKRKSKSKEEEPSENSLKSRFKKKN